MIHKSDVGGVLTGIENAGQLGKAYDQLLDNIRSNAPTAEISGVIVQKQLSRINTTGSAKEADFKFDIY